MFHIVEHSQILLVQCNQGSSFMKKDLLHVLSTLFSISHLMLAGAFFNMSLLRIQSLLNVYTESGYSLSSLLQNCYLIGRFVDLSNDMTSLEVSASSSATDTTPGRTCRTRGTARRTSTRTT